MSLPRWWPRVSCVYCGARIHVGTRLTCERHAYLILCDPHYTEKP